MKVLKHRKGQRGILVRIVGEHAAKGRYGIYLGSTGKLDTPHRVLIGLTEFNFPDKSIDFL